MGSLKPQLKLSLPWSPLQQLATGPRPRVDSLMMCWCGTSWNRWWWGHCGKRSGEPTFSSCFLFFALLGVAPAFVFAKAWYIELSKSQETSKQFHHKTTV